MKYLKLSSVIIVFVFLILLFDACSKSSGIQKTPTSIQYDSSYTLWNFTTVSYGISQFNLLAPISIKTGSNDITDISINGDSIKIAGKNIGKEDVILTDSKGTKKYLNVSIIDLTTYKFWYSPYQSETIKNPIVSIHSNNQNFSDSISKLIVNNITDTGRNFGALYSFDKNKSTLEIKSANLDNDYKGTYTFSSSTQILTLNYNNNTEIYSVSPFLSDSIVYITLTQDITQTLKTSYPSQNIENASITYKLYSIFAGVQ